MCYSGPYGSLEALVKAELGVEVEESKAVKLGQWGGDRRSEAVRQNQGSIRTLKRGDGQVAYLTARIARDRPDILERMKAGEYPSVRAAALEAGATSEMGESS